MGVSASSPQLPGQTVVVIGGSAGIGLATARRAREEGAEVVITGRNSERVDQAAAEISASILADFRRTLPDSAGAQDARLRVMKTAAER